MRYADPSATQYRHPWRTTLRTVAWYVLTVLAVLPLAIPILTEELGDHLGPRVVGALLWVAGVAGAVLAAVQRIVLLAPVADLLARVGLGTGGRDGGGE